MVVDKKTDPNFAKLIKNFAPNQYLFSEGDVGTTTFLIINGTVRLIHGTGNDTYLVETLGSGDVLGEKAILNKGPYRHALSAQAAAQTTAIEFEAQHLKLVEAKFPNFTLRLLSTICERLDKANELIKILQSNDEPRRLVQYLTYYIRHNKTGVAHFSDLPILIEEVQSIIKMEKELIEKCLRFLTDKKVLVKKENIYFLVDEEGLTLHLLSLQKYLSDKH